MYCQTKKNDKFIASNYRKLKTINKIIVSRNQ